MPPGARQLKKHQVKWAGEHQSREDILTERYSQSNDFETLPSPNKTSGGLHMLTSYVALLESLQLSFLNLAKWKMGPVFHWDSEVMITETQGFSSCSGFSVCPQKSSSPESEERRWSEKEQTVLQDRPISLSPLLHYMVSYLFDHRF